MSTKRKTVDVSLLGRVYKVACGEDEREALLASVAYLDEKMHEIKNTGKVASPERIAVMAALNITNELLSSRNERAGFDIESLKRRMHSMQAILDGALAPQERLL